MSMVRLSLAVALSFGINEGIAGPLLGSDLVYEAVFSKTYTTTGANSKVFGNVLSGDVSTIGANANVYGNLESVGAATTGGAGSTVSGTIVSGDVLTTGDGSIIGGNITSSGASTVGANSQIGGNMVAGGVATTGASSIVTGNISAGGATSIGATATVVGSVSAVGAISVSVSGTVGSQQTLASSPIDGVAFTAAIDAKATSDGQQVSAAQATLTSMGTGTLLAATITTDRTLIAGVYSAPSLSTTAGTTLFLDGQGLANQFWVFNISNILATGASTVIKLINPGINNDVVWNAGGYASLGASSTFIGTILADKYISVGANTNVLGVSNTCVGVYSATSYVSTGDASVIGGNGCSGRSTFIGSPAPGVSAISDVPEPASWPLLLTGLLMAGAVTRRARHQT